MTEETSRYINRLKGLLIVLVVIGHFGQTIGNALADEWSCLAQATVLLIYTFHMPAFLFLSGYLTTDAERSRAKAASGLLIPFFTYQVVVGVALFVLKGSTEALRNMLVPQFGAWYLLTLFTYRYFLPDWLRLRHPILLAIALSLVSSAFADIGNVCSLQKSIGFLPFFLVGYFARHDKRELVSIKGYYPSLVGLVVAWLLLLTVCMNGQYGVLFRAFTHQLTASGLYEIAIAVVMNAIAIVIATAVFSMVSVTVTYLPRWFERIGHDTLPLYLSHLLVFMAVSLVANKDDAVMTSIICVGATLFSILVFSNQAYINCFNGAMDYVRSWLLGRNVIRNKQEITRH